MNSHPNPIPIEPMPIEKISTPSGENPTAKNGALLETLATLVAWVGILGLILLMAKGAMAQTPPPPPAGGFNGGDRAFSSPFQGGQPPAQENMFPDEEEDELVFPEDNQTAGGGYTPPSTGGGGGGGVSSSGGPGNPTAGGGGISVGGTPAGGVVQGRQVPSIRIDSESAEGSKEVITDFNFPDADIMDIAKTLAKLTGKNFILDKDVKGRVTIISNSPITVGDAWKAFLTALDMSGFALIPSGSYIRIARQRDARDKQLRTYTGDYSPDTDALITRVFPLKYLDAEEVARNFRSFMPANSRIIPYNQTNTVIVTDTGSNISKLNKLLEILDVEGYDAGIEVIPVKFASAAELAKLIDTLIPGTPAGPTGGGGAPRFGGGGGRFTARRTKEGGIINTIIADERTNTMIVHANSRGADQVRSLVSKLDQRVAASAGGGKIHVVYLQFAEAEQIANTLNNLSAQAASTAPKPATGTGAGTGTNPVQASLFEGSIKVSADKSTNSLVITASPNDFVTVQRVINKLDIPRDQVYAEVVIMEVSLGKNFNFSTNVVNPVNGIFLTPNTDLFKFVADPTSLKGAILNFQGGKKTKVKIGGTEVEVGGVTGLINAIQANSNANVLATPQILTLDNTEATFETTEKIPFPTTTAVQGSVSTSVSKENVSLSITIKPQINKLSNFVKLDITTKLADINQRELPAQVKDLAFATIERNAKTSVVVADQDTVVLGGLVRDNLQETVSKVPILGDIPILGWLFKSKTSQSSKTNLLVFITPKIIRQYENIRAILDKKLKERDDFLEANTGGQDPMRPHRDKMIRSLPDIDKIANSRPNNFQSLDKDAFAGSSNEDDEKGANYRGKSVPDAAATPLPGTGTVPPPSDFNPGQDPIAPTEGGFVPPPAPPVPEGQ